MVDWNEVVPERGFVVFGSTLSPLLRCQLSYIFGTELGCSVPGPYGRVKGRIPPIFRKVAGLSYQMDKVRSWVFDEYYLALGNMIFRLPQSILLAPYSALSVGSQLGN